MSKFIFIIPTASEDEAQTYVDDEAIKFEPHLWVNGVPEDTVDDWGMAVNCGDGTDVTHLMLWGDLPAAQVQGLLAAVSGSAAYPAHRWNRRTAAADMDLVLMGDGLKKEAHLLRMPTMVKIWDMDDAPFTGGAESDKWDGYTCSLRYNNGELRAGITQDDGVTGTVRTRRLGRIVPATVNRTRRIQIEGEVITNTNRPERAVFAMHEATRRQFNRLGCKFIAFNVRGTNHATWSAAMAWLDSQGFDTVLNYTDPDYPKDGRVYRIDNYAEHDLAPVGMFAFKFEGNL